MVPSTAKRFYAPGKRALAISFAALLMIGGLEQGYAQNNRRLPRGLLPAPGNVGMVINLLGYKENRAVVTANQHPLFESSWMGHPDEIIANTKYGKVSSADLWLWMMLRESPNKAYMLQVYQKAKLPKEREELAKALKVEIDEYVFTNFVMPKMVPSVARDPIYDLKHEVYTLPAWQAVFLEKVVKPRVTITEADRQKYLQEHVTDVVEPERLRARYIFKRSMETDPNTEQDRIEVELDELRASILRGDVDFAAAARAHSEAPSASNGGEIPPFGAGELFYLFENAAGSLEPGGVSRVFRGPNGFYIVQLIERIPAEKAEMTNARQAKLVDEALSRQVLKANYDIYMRHMLEERRLIKEKVWAWDSLEDGETVGEVCNYLISKGQFRSAWPGVEGNDVRLKMDIIGTQLRAILEREAMAQDVRELGFANDPMLERARWMAANIIRRDAWVDGLRQQLPISETLVQNFWKNNPSLFTPLSLKRVIKLTLTPSNTAPLPAQTRMEMEQVLAEAAGQPRTVAVAKREVLDEERSSIVYDTLERTEDAYKLMNAPDEGMNFYISGELTSGTVTDAVSSDTATEVPSLQGNESATEASNLDSSESVSTDTLQSLNEQPTSGETLDLQTSAPRGGAGQGPARGGITRVGGSDILPNIDPADDPNATPVPAAQPEVTRSGSVIEPFRTPAPRKAEYLDETAERGPTLPLKANAVKPAITPRSGAVPVGMSAPAIAPGAVAQPTPNIRKQQPPPPTSYIPYNPDWFYPRKDFSEVKEVIGKYASSDWLLTTADLGFVYVEDLADAPRKLEKVPVGAISRPVVNGQSAVSWYIEEARTVEKQPFEAIKTHAYDVFRNTQIDKSVTNTYNKELEKANIEYRF